MQTIPLNHKEIRASVIADYLKGAHCFAFTCGNAGRWLERVGANVAIVDDKILKPQKILTQAEIRRFFPHSFNATSGYLPTFLMAEISNRIEKAIGAEIADRDIVVPFGSGELIVALATFHRFDRIIAITGETYAPTLQDGSSPLARLVENNVLEVVRTAASNAEELKAAAAELFDGLAYIDTSAAEQ